MNGVDSTLNFSAVPTKPTNKKQVKGKALESTLSADTTGMESPLTMNTNAQEVAVSIGKRALQDNDQDDHGQESDYAGTPSPSKSRVKPSTRVPAGAVLPVVSKRTNPSASQKRKSGGIVFTDDEDASADTEQLVEEGAQLDDSVEYASDGGGEDAQFEDGMQASGNEFIDDAAVVAEDGDSGSEDGDANEDDEEYARSHSVHSTAAHASQASAVPNKSVKKLLESMEAEEKMFKEARKNSVASIAGTNPGDGTMRLYGEQSYIHDDVLGNPAIIRQDVRAPVTPERPRKAGRAQDNKFLQSPAILRQPARAPVTPVKSRNVDPVVDTEEDHKYLTDFDPRGQLGPARCQIASRDDMDPIIDYSKLPALLAGKRLESWSTTAGPGLAVPSAWHEQIPGISMSQLRNVIQFRNQGHIYNPSRMTPSEMGLAPHPGNSYIVPAGTTRAATFTTAVLVTSSNLYRMKEVFGEERRMISGIPHNGEWQRMEAAILMCFHLNSAHAQIAQQAITFSTSRTMSNVSTSPAKNPSRMFRQPAGASSSGGSPFAVPQSNVQGAGYVPILDGRNTRFSMQENLQSLDRILPPFNAEVPEGSCAWIGYTVNKYTTNKGNNLNFNLLWVVVLGIPE
ncbi:hypothetical protein HWV62_24354 [Athelia sp. TMB]|nr:hypothetical protein HWV62_24354 [Athelia sp. TMB]